ncbi:MAG: GNAT family N-acetyltransferase [Acidobacteriota bacterium]|nr:MAG: GNAT family N-acetyltransferase [Acidobacteriota bacterium]
MSENYQIRPSRENDLKILNDIENAASELFQNTKYGLEIDQDPLPIEMLRNQSEKGLVWVAVDGKDRPVGFAVAILLENYAHLHELSVHPKHGRKGLGRRLVDVVIQFARESKLSGVTLSTFRDIAWNAPFYRKLGFCEMCDGDIEGGLKEIRMKESELGLPVSERVMMKLTL